MKKHIIITLIIIALIILIILTNGIYCDNHLETKKYNITSDKTTANLHFIVVADQHNNEIGKNNSKLIKKIKAEKPDFIAVCGDMVTRGINNDDIMKKFLTEAAKIAPTYCVLGNHERDMMNETDEVDIPADIKNAGAILLDNEIIEFEKNGEKILIGGLTDYPFYDNEAPDYDNPHRYLWDEINEKAKDKFTILLHHQPEFISSNLNDSNIDLVLCGHTHGGLVRIPFLGGLLAPNQGIFAPYYSGPLPKYTKGEYDFNNTKMIITSGVGNPSRIPRINNCVEITVVNVN